MVASNNPAEGDAGIMTLELHSFYYLFVYILYI